MTLDPALRFSDSVLRPSTNHSEILVRAENVGKKFCRSLKRSLWYGMQDMTAELFGGSTKHDQLRKEEFWAVHDVSFELRRGECLGLIGRNGAGKTTLLKMLNGLIKPDQGRIEMRGRIGALIALGAGFNPILTGRENIYVNGSVLGFTKREITEKIDEIIDFSEISEFIDTPVQSYSSGMQVRLGFAVASALNPDVLILDEVLAVGDAPFRVKCFNRMYEVLENAAVIFVSHSMPLVTRICNRLILLQRGEVVADSSNLGAVVAEYHSRMESGLTPATQGSGKTRIHSISLENKNGSPTSSLVYGEPFEIIAKITAPNPSALSNLQLLITVSDQEQNSVAQVLEAIDHADFRHAEDHLEVRLSFEKTSFNAGRYFVTANILVGARGELSCVVRNAVEFVVQHQVSGFAPILLSPSKMESKVSRGI